MRSRDNTIKMDEVSMPPFVKWTRNAIAVIVFSIAVSGCVSDAAAPSSSVSQENDRTPALRYYGGPKSPMWQGQ